MQNLTALMTLRGAALLACALMAAAQQRECPQAGLALGPTPTPFPSAPAGAQLEIQIARVASSGAVCLLGAV
jgi:hypothetical protein